MIGKVGTILGDARHQHRRDAGRPHAKGGQALMGINVDTPARRRRCSSGSWPRPAWTTPGAWSSRRIADAGRESKPSRSTASLAAALASRLARLAPCARMALDRRGSGRLSPRRRFIRRVPDGRSGRAAWTAGRHARRVGRPRSDQRAGLGRLGCALGVLLGPANAWVLETTTTERAMTTLTASSSGCGAAVSVRTLGGGTARSCQVRALDRCGAHRRESLVHGAGRELTSHVRPDHGPDDPLIQPAGHQRRDTCRVFSGFSLGETKETT